MSCSLTNIEQRRRVAQVIDHILTNLTDEISLQSLAGVANYSPFHLQKIFKQVIGESPKQFTINLRMETALLLLTIHPHKSIQEIAMECGYSSPALFSRAVKSCFGYSPERLRGFSHLKRMKILQSINPGSCPGQPLQSGSAAGTGPIAIQTIKRNTVKGIYLLAPLDRPGEIQQAFQALSRIAGAHGWGPVDLYGILAPHQRNIYKVFLPINQENADTKKLLVMEIKGGIFASFTVSGDPGQVSRAVHQFYYFWLPDSGYKIASATGFETFAQNPASTHYLQLERRIHIPIEPAI